MQILNENALGALTEDELKTMLLQRHPMIKPNELDMPREELLIALLTAAEEVA